MSDETPLPLVGTSSVMRALAARAGELQRDVTRPVLLVGARGLGKRYLAQRIHLGSTLSMQPLQVVDARRDEEAALRLALDAARAGGTLMVRHVEYLAPAAQLLLDQRTDARSGVARLMATTSTDLVARVTSGAFIESLYYRLHAWPMLLPPLAERGVEDLVALAEAVLRQTADGDADLPVTLDAAAHDALGAHDWPENLRELEAMMALAQLRARGTAVVGPAHLSLRGDDAGPPPPSAPLADVERWHLLRALATFRGNRTHAARSLGISRMTLIGKLKGFLAEPVSS